MTDKLEKLANAAKKETLSSRELESLNRSVGDFVRANPRGVERGQAVTRTALSTPVAIALAAILIALAGFLYHEGKNVDPLELPPTATGTKAISTRATSTPTSKRPPAEDWTYKGLESEDKKEENVAPQAQASSTPPDSLATSTASSSVDNPLQLQEKPRPAEAVTASSSGTVIRAQNF